MATSISIFNNKGGVGKTTFLFHVAHRLADQDHKVLMVDCDSQCNLTAYALDDRAIERAWTEGARSGGNSIYRLIEPVARTTGDVRDRAPVKLNDSLFLLPGDLLLSDFEDRLGDTWNSAKGGSEASLRAQSAIFRAIKNAAEKAEAEIILIDLGPNLGALNRAVLGGTDHVIVPISPDLFSIRGTENLGSKLETWRREWDQCNDAWSGEELPIPQGRPKFLGYVVQQHNIRNNAAGMTQGWQIFGNRVEQSVRQNIVDRLLPLDQVVVPSDDNYNLGMIPNLHSLIPYAMKARKPVYKCTSQDGLRGAHIRSAAESGAIFDPVVSLINEMTLATT
ncbi:MAG: AAA family ATPase [Cyanobacteria bacterium P01_B01_bin.77]